MTITIAKIRSEVTLVAVCGSSKLQLYNEINLSRILVLNTSAQSDYIKPGMEYISFTVIRILFCNVRHLNGILKIFSRKSSRKHTHSITENKNSN